MPAATRSASRRRGEADAPPPEPGSPRRRRPRSVSPLGSVDPATRWLYEPHTVTGLVIGVALLIWYTGALSRAPTPVATDRHAGIRRGLGGAAAAWAVYSVLQGPPLILARPHPAFWRVVHGAAVAYLLILVYIACQTAADARRVLVPWFPELGVPLPEKSYGADCRLTVDGAPNWPLLKATLFDEFVVAHVLGWFAKAVLLRDRALLWPLSIGFELAEACLWHVLPNFNECWWDSWILDVAICNLIGLEAGLAAVRAAAARAPREWRGVSAHPTAAAKARRAAAQFTPRSLTLYEWRPTASRTRGAAAFFLVAVFLLFDVHAFFLKAALWVPSLNPLVTARIALIFLLGVPAVNEYYAAATRAPGLPPARLGRCAWLLLAIAAAEALVCVKFAPGPVHPPTPRIVAAWWVTAAAVAAWAAVWVGGVGVRGKKGGRRALK